MEPVSGKAPTAPARSGWARWKQRLLKLLLALGVFLVALKLADLAVGSFRETRLRHRLGLVPNVSQTHRTFEYEYVFTTNAHGLRDADRTTAKPPGILRIAVLGDSFVAGVGVPDDQTLTVNLERLLNEAAGAALRGNNRAPRYEVLNFGRTGSATVRQVELYEQVARRFEPDLVVLVIFVGNDLVEVMEEQTPEEAAAWRPAGLARGCAYRLFPNLYLELAMLKQAALQRRVEGGLDREELWQEIVAAADPRGFDRSAARRRFEALPPKILEAACQGRFSLALCRHACLEPDRLMRALSPEETFIDEAWPRLRSRLDRLLRLTKQDGARLAVVLAPHAVQVDRQAWNAAQELGFEVRPEWLTQRSFLQRAVPVWCDVTAVPDFDLAPPLRRVPHAYYPYDGHWTIPGTQSAAQALMPFVQSHLSPTDEPHP